MKTAYAMPCSTPEQAEEMRKLCEMHGIEIEGDWSKSLDHITNNYNNRFGEVSFIWTNSRSDFDRKVIPYNPALFLYSLGVFPEKWCVRGSEEFKQFVNKKFGVNSYPSCMCTEQEHFYWLDENNNITTSIAANNKLEDHIEVTLEDLIKHYEKPKTNDMRIKVKIISAKKSNWYKVGEEYEVLNNDLYYYDYTEYKTILKSDCEIIDKPTEQPTLKLTITRTELKEIYDIACDWWKPKIAQYAKRLDLATDTITFTESEVKEMFKAAVEDQPKVLERIFGNPRKSELLAEKEKLQKRVAEIDKELNN